MGRTLVEIIDQGSGAPGHGIASVNETLTAEIAEDAEMFLVDDRQGSLCYAARKFQMVN